MAKEFSLNSEQRAEFEEQGVLHLPAFYPANVVSPMADAIWNDLQRRHGIERDRRETWTIARPAQFGALARTGVFNPLLDDKTSALADEFLGEGTWDEPGHFGGPLVTFPMGRWDVPAAHWHLDGRPRAYLTSLPHIRVFVFLDAVGPRGGGTCYVSGAHRVAMEIARHVAQDESLRSADVKVILQREEPWFAALFSKNGGNREERFMQQEGHARGIAVRVREMTGEAGDLIVMHPAMLHTIAPNGLARPRMMLVHSLFHRGLEWTEM